MGDMISDPTMDQWRELRRNVQAGELSDWEKFHHGVSMTCGNFVEERHWLARWVDQLAEVLVDKKVESTPPWQRVDSLGDRWMVLHPNFFAGREDGRAA